MPNLIVTMDDDDPVNELFNSLDSNQKVPVSFKDDPVVLACAAHRQGTYTDFENIVPTEQDRALGAQVRKHFMDKLVMQRLRGGSVSAFREKLGAFLVDNRPLHKDEIGMLYHLPYFYFEDQESQALVETTAPVEPVSPHHRKVTLSPYRIITLKRRTGNIIQYWWRDAQQQPYCLGIRENNDNQTLYRSIWEFASIDIEASMYTRPFKGTDRYHYKLGGLKLLGVYNG